MINNEIVKEINTGNCILWIDNYAKVYKQYNLTKGGFQVARWTAMGIIKTKNIDFTKGFVFFFLPTKPLLSYKEQEFMDIINFNPAIPLEDIYIIKHDNPTIPLSVLPQHRNKGKYKFLTYKIVKDDISSTDGLTNVVHNFYSKFY